MTDERWLSVSLLERLLKSGGWCICTDSGQQKPVVMVTRESTQLVLHMLRGRTMVPLNPAYSYYETSPGRISIRTWEDRRQQVPRAEGGGDRTVQVLVTKLRLIHPQLRRTHRADQAARDAMTWAIARAQIAAARSILEAKWIALTTYFTERCRGQAIATITVREDEVSIRLADGTWLALSADWLKQCLMVQLDNEEEHLI
ncbi:MAG TPA: hypothetical protein VLI05_00770 [Candidatus Saccharimonadia bacterium]|nr:hypothetical protein [Candidatus Saccharimonadia bacterium]